MRQYVIHCHKTSKDVQATFLCMCVWLLLYKKIKQGLFMVYMGLCIQMWLYCTTVLTLKQKLSHCWKRIHEVSLRVQEEHWLKRFRNADITSSAKNILLQLAIHIQFQLELTDVQQDYCHKHLACITAKLYFTCLGVF